MNENTQQKDETAIKFFNQECKQLGITKAELNEMLAKFYKLMFHDKKNMDYTSEAKDGLEITKKITDKKIKKDIEYFFTKYALKKNSLQNNSRFVDAKIKIDEKINILIKQNENANKESEKIKITPTFVSKMFLKEKTHPSHNVIKRAFDMREKEITEHNEKHGMTDILFNMQRNKKENEA